MQDTDAKKSYKHTLNLPQTEFPIRANAKIDDPLLIERWEKEDLFKKSSECHKGATKFLLSDGPPYANGPIHLGHAYNKILKDIVAKSRRMKGLHVPCVPGWDCHGLPIELKVAQENNGVDRLTLKKACRIYAQKWIDVQISDFKRLAVLMDWDRPYKTMDLDYEATIIRCFGQLVEQGFIERKNKTVPWCASCQTVLATAEIEYAERKDPSIYVLFALDEQAKAALAPSLKDKQVFCIIWTTTPWTLPLNQAVLLNPDTVYAVINIGNDRYGIVANDLVDRVTELLGIEKHIVHSFSASIIPQQKYTLKHPLADKWVPLIKDSSVLIADGTACVHSAPGAGPEDYEIGLRYNLPIFSPVGPDGVMTIEIAPAELAGKTVEQAQSWVLQKLTENGLLLFKNSIKHSYPHCWRCRKGLIFRATKQWFCSLTHNQLKEKSVTAIDSMLMLPESSDNRLKATIQARYEWCLSRQRVWGTPIPALLCKQCDYVHCTKDFINTVADLVAQKGIELWETINIHSLVTEDFMCPSCGCKEFTKENDILDVWFDAGVSHTAVQVLHPEMTFPLDLYLEGKDQHRGYFQSALLTSMALHNQSCMKVIITHGFTVDAKGRKMSKSLGNGISPQELIEKIGTDCVRLWAASIDLSGEAVVSDTLINNLTEVYRKVRNTCRFLLSNIYDFDVAVDAVSIDRLTVIDKHALYELYKVHTKIMTLYDEYNFTAVSHTIADYITMLSSFHLDIIKDRLYVEQADGHVRRSAQTVCYYVLDTVTHLIAPIFSILAEQLTDCYQKNKSESVHLQKFTDPLMIKPLLDDIKLVMSEDKKEDALLLYEELWTRLKTVRPIILKAIEIVRQKGDIKHSLEARVEIFVDKNASVYNDIALLQKMCTKSEQTVEHFMAEFCIVSQFLFILQRPEQVIYEHENVVVYVAHAKGVKCPRCWQWQETTHLDGLCGRCQSIVQ